MHHIVSCCRHVHDGACLATLYVCGRDRCDAAQSASHQRTQLNTPQLSTASNLLMCERVAASSKLTPAPYEAASSHIHHSDELNAIIFIQVLALCHRAQVLNLE